METQTSTRSVHTPLQSSTVLYRYSMAAAVIFLTVSQVILAVVIPSYGAVPPAAIVTAGSLLTFFGFLSVMVMVYAMMIRRQGR